MVDYRNGSTRPVDTKDGRNKPGWVQLESRSLGHKDLDRAGTRWGDEAAMDNAVYGENLHAR